MVEGNSNCTLYVQFITLSVISSIALHFPKYLFLSQLPNEILCIFNFSSSFLLSHLSHCLSAHHPPLFTHHSFCPICPTIFQLTTHHHSLTISSLPSVPLPLSSPPNTLHSPYILSHLSHCLSAHHPPPFTHHFFSPICPTLFQLTTHHHSLTISPVPPVPLSFSSPPTTTHSPVQTMQPLTVQFCPSRR